MPDLAAFIRARTRPGLVPHCEHTAYTAILSEHQHTTSVPADWLGAAGEKPSATPWGCRTCHQDDGVVLPHGWCKTLQALAAIWAARPDHQQALATPPDTAAGGWYPVPQEDSSGQPA